MPTGAPELDKRPRIKNLKSSTYIESKEVCNRAVTYQPFKLRKPGENSYVSEQQVVLFFLKKWTQKIHGAKYNLRHFLVLLFLYQVPNKSLAWYLLNPCQS